MRCLIGRAILPKTQRQPRRRDDGVDVRAGVGADGFFRPEEEDIVEPTASFLQLLGSDHVHSGQERLAVHRPAEATSNGGGGVTCNKRVDYDDGAAALPSGGDARSWLHYADVVDGTGLPASSSTKRKKALSLSRGTKG